MVNSVKHFIKVTDNGYLRRDYILIREVTSDLQESIFLLENENPGFNRDWVILIWMQWVKDSFRKKLYLCKNRIATLVKNNSMFNDI